jgi:hypothetical protein
MKTYLPGYFVYGKISVALLLLLFFHGTAHSQATAPLKFGNSYVNLTKKTIGGPVEPGDTLEIRTNFYVKNDYNGAGMMYKVRYYDNLPTFTDTIASDSLRLITNEGKTFRRYTQTPGDDAGSFVKVVIPGNYQIRINMGGAPTAAAPGIPGGINPMGLANTVGASTIQGGANKPLFSSGSIFCTSFRVRVTGAYGDTIVLGAGKIVYRVTGTASSDTALNAIQYKILIQKPSTLCSSGTSTNFAAESGGTFGHGVGRNRSTPPSFLIPGYTYLPTSGTATTINDGYYAIVNNTSPTSSTFAGANRQPACGALPNGSPNSCFNREFDGFWFISGDHTGTVTAAGNPPPGATTDGGYMLLVNADLATSEAYHQVINGLCPNTYYQFSTWIKNVCPNCGIDSNGHATYLPGVLPNLTLVVDGIDRISSGQMDTVGWQQRGFVLLTGPNQSSITISIRTNAPGGGGNDWAVDDITLATCPPELLLTPNKPDTLCQGADDTVKFKITSFVDNYTHWTLQKSTDGGSTWMTAGPDTLGRPASDSTIAVKDPSTGLYTYTVTRYFRIASTDNLVIYRIIVASTLGNLTTNGCFYTTSQPKLIYGVNCLIALPTTLLSFKGQVREGLGNLQWATGNEVAGILYTLERSDDGVHFTDIGTIPGTAGQGQGAVYQFADPRPVSAQTWYRVNIGSNSIHRYSNQVLLSNSGIGFEVRSIVNPFADHISIDFTTPGDGMAIISLVDIYGQFVKKVRQPVYQGLNNLTLYGLGSLSIGTYALQIQYNDQVISKKLVKLSK